MRVTGDAAIGAEVERLRDGVVSATEYQRINPDALSPLEAMFQRILDSHKPDTLPAAMFKMLSRPGQAALASSPSPILASTPIEEVVPRRKVFLESAGSAGGGLKCYELGVIWD